MFESIRGQTPELTSLQEKVASLEQETYEAESRVRLLHQELHAARESDIDLEARCLNAGRRVPKPKAPDIESKIVGAERRLEVLRRRLALVQGELSVFIAENAHSLADLIRQAKAEKSREVAELARPLAKVLNEYQQPDLDLRALRPHLQGKVEENTGNPQDTTLFLGRFGRKNAFGETVGGKTLGELQALVEALAGLQHGGEPGLTVVGPLEDAEDEDGEVA